jgi:hypothetical protein
MTKATRTKKMNASVKNNMTISSGSTQQNSTISSDFKSTLIASTPAAKQPAAKQPAAKPQSKNWLEQRVDDARDIYHAVKKTFTQETTRTVVKNGKTYRYTTKSIASEVPRVLGGAVGVTQALGQSVKGALWDFPKSIVWDMPNFVVGGVLDWANGNQNALAQKKAILQVAAHYMKHPNLAYRDTILKTIEEAKELRKQGKNYEASVLEGNILGGIAAVVVGPKAVTGVLGAAKQLPKIATGVRLAPSVMRATGVPKTVIGLKDFVQNLETAVNVAHVPREQFPAFVASARACSFEQFASFPQAMRLAIIESLKRFQKYSDEVKTLVDRFNLFESNIAKHTKPSQKPALPVGKKTVVPTKQNKNGAIVLATKSGALVTPIKIKMPTSIKLVPMAGVNNSSNIVALPQRETTTLRGRTIVISRHNGKTTAHVNGGETIDIPANVSAKGNGVIAHFALTKHQSTHTQTLPKSTLNQTANDLDALKQIGIDHQNSPTGQRAKQELQKVPTMMAKDVSGESAEGGDGSFRGDVNVQEFEPPKEIRLYTEGYETISKDRQSAIYAKVRELEFDTVLGKTVEQLFSKAMDIFKKYNRAEKEAFVALLKDNLVTRNSLINSPSFVSRMKEQRIKSLDKNGSGDVKFPTINTVLLPITDHPFDITNHRSRMPEELVAINFHAVFNDPSIGSFNRTNYPNGINDDFRNNANSGYQPFYRYGSDMVNSPEVFLNLDKKILDRLKNVALSDKERKIISRVMFNFNSPAEAQFAKLSELFDFTANENRTIVNLLRMLPNAKIEIMRQYVLKKMIEKHSGFVKDIFQDIPPVKHAKYDEQYVNILIKHMKDTVRF